MFRQLPIFLLVTAFAFACEAQPLMLKNIRAGRPSMMFGSVIPEGNGYVVSGVTSNPTEPYYARSVIGRLNGQGDFTSVRYLFDNQEKLYGTFVNNLFKSPGGNYVYGGYAGDTVPSVIIVKADESLNTTLYEYDSADLFAYKANCIVEREGSFYVGGVITKTGKSNILLIKTDTSGQLSWQKVYGTLPNAENATSLIALENGNLLIGSFRRDYASPIENANTWLLEVDTAGDIVRQWFDDNDSTLGAYGLRRTSDGGFIYVGQKIYLQQMHTVNCIGMATKLDSNFNVQWRWSGGNAREITGLYDVEELSDGSFVACGNNPYLNGTVMTGAWVVKLSASGSLIWQKHYSGSNEMDTENYLNDIDVLPNGNLVAVGETRDYTDINRGQMGLLLVMDSNGCIIENCTVGIEDIEPQAEINIYPNPTSDAISINIKNTVLYNATITISNHIGQMLQQHNGVELSNSYGINLGGYAKGLYLVTIEADGNRIVKQVVKE